MKKETIEEASERAVKSGLFKDKTLFIAGAYWNQEISYSEQDMIDFAYYYTDERKNKEARALTPELLIKQFKKK